MGKDAMQKCAVSFFVSRLLDGLSVSMNMTKEKHEMAFCGKEWLVWHCMIGMAMGKRI